MFIEIIPYLYIGSSCNENDFNIIINCHKPCLFLQKYNNHRLTGEIRVKDYEYLDELTSYIYKNIINHKSVILLSKNASQFNFTVMCVYLIKYGKLKIKDILVNLKSKMDINFTKLTYLDIFYKFEKNFLSL